jgi:O-antigen/teichoic acid export membrane protein
MKEPGWILFIAMLATSFLIFFVARWIYRKMKGNRWFKTKTFMARFVFAPVIFIWCLLANYENESAMAIILMVFAFAAMDRLAAWFDRNVPDSHPDKYR